MPYITHPTALDGSVCPVCGGPVTLERDIRPRDFSVRYWVQCRRHGILGDLASWLDQEWAPSIVLPDDQAPAA